MTSRRSLILDWAETGVLSADRLPAALARAGVTPGAAAWRRFIDRLLLWAAILLLSAAVIFFMAYNWHEFGRLARFGLLEFLLLLMLVLLWRLGLERASGRAVLFAAALLVGALLALFGQIYQAGADIWQLFATWAVLILPWVLLGRLPVLWMLWLALVNLALVLYVREFPGLWGILFGGERLLLLLFGLNTLALAVWEFAARRLDWLAERWAVRLLGLAGGAAITVFIVMMVIDDGLLERPSSILYPIWIAGMYGVYRHLCLDLFMLAGLALSIIVTVTALLTRFLMQELDVDGFLLVSLAVTGMAAAAALWLKQLAAELPE